jgi:hypothetical protein
LERSGALTEHAAVVDQEGDVFFWLLVDSVVTNHSLDSLYHFFGFDLNWEQTDIGASSNYLLCVIEIFAPNNVFGSGSHEQDVGV